MCHQQNVSIDTFMIVKIVVPFKTAIWVNHRKMMQYQAHFKIYEMKKDPRV